MKTTTLLLLPILMGISEISAQTNSGSDANDSIQLSIEEKQIDLQEVKVVAKKRALSIRNDKMVFKPEASVGGKTNIYDMLQSLPGVRISSDGTISLNGRNGVVVMIDGRKQQLSGQQLSNLLRSMQADNVAEVEIIDNPSVEHEASASAGIIQINSKRDRQKGQQLNLSGFYEHGKRPRWQTSLSYNCQLENYSFYTNFGYYNRHELCDLNIYRDYMEDKKNSYQKSYRKFRNDGIWAQIGLDVNISKNTVAGIYSNFNQNNRPETGVTDTYFFTSARLDSLAYTFNDVSEKARTSTSGIYLSNRVKDRHQFEINAEYTYYDFSCDNRQHSYFRDLLQTDSVPGKLNSDPNNRLDIYSAQIGYKKNFDKTLALKAGARSNYTNLNQDMNFTRLKDNSWYLDKEISNHANYDEIITGAYVMAELNFGKLSINGGLRAEHTDIEGQQGQTGTAADSCYTQHYTDYFPGASVQYAFNERNVLSLQYSKKIKRPGYRQLSPYIIVFDDYTYEVGNPNLKPQTINSIEMSYMFNRSIRLNSYYSKGSDVISKCFETRSDGRVYVVPNNLAQCCEYGVKMNASAFSPIKWLDINLYGNYFHREYDFTANGDDYNNYTNTLIYFVQTRFILPASFTLELSASGFTDMTEGASTVKGSWQMWGGISRSFCQGKGNITLYAKDIFHTYHENLDIPFNNQLINTTQRNDFSYFGISLSWSFNKGKEIKKDKRTLTQNENKRINL